MVATTRFCVAQLGARMHYAVPRILHTSGMLEQLYTDICVAKGWPRLFGALPEALLPRQIRRLKGRHPEGIPQNHITAFTSLGVSYYRRLASARSEAETMAAFLRFGKEFCRQILRHGIPDVEGVYTFNSAGLEVLREARRRGMLAVTEQTIAPREIEYRMIAREHRAHPDWEMAPGDNPHIDTYAERERAEWEHADVIVCGSEFVARGIAEAGGPAQKCTIVPYGVDMPVQMGEKKPSTGPLRVLTVGSVGLRKGSPYVMQAAQALKDKAKFRMVGPIGVLPAAEARLRQHVELVGPVPRSEIIQHFDWADVFLLPSLCEGSATVSYEALGLGLPVVCTPNTGSVIRDGVDGYIVPEGSTDAIVERLEQIHSDAALFAYLSQNAHQRAKQYTVNAYGERLLGVLNRQ